MTHEATHAKHDSAAGAAMLPAIFSIILTLIWGSYTALVLYEIFRLPMPAH